MLLKGKGAIFLIAGLVFLFVITGNDQRHITKISSV